MKLAQLLSIFPQLKWGENPHLEVSHLSQDSRQVDEKTVFFAIRGSQVDGHDFIQEVCSQKPAAIVVEEDSNVAPDFKGAVVVVEDSRKAMSDLAARFYDNPTRNMFCVGVTGTNGKTSITYLVEKIFDQFRWKSGVMGTINHHLGNHRWNSSLTTPGALELQKRLSEFKALGAEAAVFEVSSHAIEQKRAENIDFNTVVFTNLSRDHLDYHKNMTDYFKVKESLFSDIIMNSKKKSKVAIVNIDDEYGQKIHVSTGVKNWSYGRHNSEALINFEILKMNFEGTEYKLRTPQGERIGFFPIPGEFYMYNVTAAVAVGLSAGISLDSCCEALVDFKGVPGRLERVKNKKGVMCFVDYAHTPEALSSALKTLHNVREALFNKPQIFTVFGCGGDRDKGKRPLMRSVAEEFSDKIFVTSDNPRTEDPQKIIDDILEDQKDCFSHIDRRKAIFEAIDQAEPGDVVLVAGKGHEDYQDVGGQKIHFSDQEVIREYA